MVIYFSAITFCLHTHMITLNSAEKKLQNNDASTHARFTKWF